MNGMRPVLVRSWLRDSVGVLADYLKMRKINVAVKEQTTFGR
jgi:hypothetical protein